MYNRPAVEEVLTDSGWVENKILSDCFKSTPTRVFIHKHISEVMIFINDKGWRIVPTCDYRYGMGVMHKKAVNRKKHERKSTDLAYGTSTASLIEKLTPAIITTRPIGILPESHVPSPKNWGNGQ
jgi:hypothetical protein